MSKETDAGFIKFGSRVDLFLPLNTKIDVKIGDKVKGGEQIVATANKMNQTSLDIQFKEAYKVISELSQDQFAPDLMLKIYAYYKQATYGDNNPEYIETNELDLRNGFKLNAWIQLRGMSSGKCQKRVH